jgi:hypothetical protein
MYTGGRKITRLASTYGDYEGKSAYSFNLTDQHSLRIKSNLVISGEVGTSLRFLVDSTYHAQGHYMNPPAGIGKCVACGKDKVSHHDGQKCYVSAFLFPLMRMPHCVPSIRFHDFYLLTFLGWIKKNGRVDGTIVSARAPGDGWAAWHARDSTRELLLDTGTDGLFVLSITKAPDLLPRVNAALVLACKCMM